MKGSTSASPDHIRSVNEARCRRLLAKSELLAVEDLDWASVGEVHIDAGVIDTLVYMRDVEGFTPTYLAGLGSHRTTLSDPLVREFLSVWQAEEAVHAESIDRFLELYAAATGTHVPSQAQAQPPQPAWYERALGLTGGLVGSLVATTHMAWGAANEYLTMNGYRMLADQCGDAVLAELLRRIAAQESRHFSFYLLQTEWRLASSRAARVLLPRFMARAWSPVGIGDGYKTEAEFERILGVLSASPDSERLIDRMDRRFSALPGFDRLRLYARACRVTGVPAWETL